VKKLLHGAILLFASIILTACMYPEERLAKNQIPYEQQLQMVQTAVNQYKDDTGGLLPIKTKNNDTPLYQKYLIDFQKLIPQYLSEAPGNAFESGGIFQYVLVNVEEDPTVKLIDLRIAETIREIKIRIQSQGYPPFKEEIANNVYTLNYELLGYKEEPFVVSPFTQNNLPLVINGNAEIFVDYRIDLYQALQQMEVSVQQGEDIRYILMENSPFVPAYSLPYTVNEKNEPVFFTN
jgi:hypothetical protein